MQISNQEKQLLITLIWSQYRQDYYQIRNPCIILSAPFLSFLVFENNIFVASRSHIEIRDWFIMLILSWVTWSWLNSEHAKKLSYLPLFKYKCFTLKQPLFVQFSIRQKPAITIIIIIFYLFSLIYYAHTLQVVSNISCDTGTLKWVN